MPEEVTLLGQIFAGTNFREFKNSRIFVTNFEKKDQKKKVALTELEAFHFCSGNF